MMVSIPELDSDFQPLVWCPMMIKLKEQNQFDWIRGCQTTGEENTLVVAMNDINYRGSLKEAYSYKSMSLPL